MTDPLQRLLAGLSDLVPTLEAAYKDITPTPNCRCRKPAPPGLRRSI